MVIQGRSQRGPNLLHAGGANTKSTISITEENRHRSIRTESAVEATANCISWQIPPASTNVQHEDNVW